MSHSPSFSRHDVRAEAVAGPSSASLVSAYTRDRDAYSSLPPIPPYASASASPRAPPSSLQNDSVAFPSPHPVIPPRSALRVRTDSGRMRSNSHAVGPSRSRFEAPGSAASFQSSGGSSGNGGATPSATSSQSSGTPLPSGQGVNGNHAFSRSFSHTITANGDSPSSGLRDARDVFAAVRGLRADVSASMSPASPNPADASDLSLSFAPEGYIEHEKEVLSFARGAADEDEGYMVEEMDEEEEVMERVRHALRKSGDNGDTLDLSRKSIEHIGPQAVEAFRSGVGRDNRGVWRLALSYNRLANYSIDASFCTLTRLRYLNLKGNLLTQFPPALSEMPALEILDLSKNHITCFPLIPGRLINLKVLSLTNNKIYSLPEYLVEFNALKVFKVDNNPIEWPPAEVLGALVESDAPPAREATAAGKEKKREEDLRPWIQNMKSWMRQRSGEAEAVLKRSEAWVEKQHLDDLVHDDAVANPVTPSTASQHTVRPIRDDSVLAEDPVRPALGVRSRSGTIESEMQSPPSRPAPLKLVTSHFRQPDTSTPPISAISSSHSRQGSAIMPPIPAPAATTHSRGASFTATQRLSGPLSAKKSLPDLRQSHAKIMQDRRESDATRGPSSARLSERGSPWSAETAPPMSALPLTGRTFARTGSADVLSRARGAMPSPLSPAGERRSSQEGPLVDDSRNSYFRRHSTLPASTVSKIIPPALLKSVDGIRGILFALSQIHAALRQYLLYAVNDRVAGLFARVMDPAGGQLNTLINALDRFDSSSRRGIPPLPLVVGVFEAARDSIGLFVKVIAMLRLQMPALRSSDARYTRTFLLMIFGSMAEVSYSWSTIANRMADVRAIMAGDTALRAGHRMLTTGRTPISPIPERGESHSPPSITRTDRTEKPLGSSPLHQATSGAEATGTPTPAGVVGRANARRQAGSFSMQDVERGMLMGRASPAPLSGRAMRHRPSASGQSYLTATEVSEQDYNDVADEDDDLYDLPNPPFAHRATRSNGSSGIPQTPPENSQALQPIAMVPTSSQGSHSRGHKPTSSAGSSHLAGHANGYGRKMSLDMRPGTPSTALDYDDDWLNVIEYATDVAFTAWLRLAEDVAPDARVTPNAPHGRSGSTSSESPITPVADRPSATRPADITAQHHAEIIDLLSRSEQITTDLRESLAGIRADPHAPPHSDARASLREQSEMFVKTVVRVTELVMRMSATHAFPPPVRQSCAELVQCTRDIAILFTVSAAGTGTGTGTRPGTAASNYPAAVPINGKGRKLRNLSSTSVVNTAGVSSPRHLYHVPAHAQSYSQLNHGGAATLVEQRRFGGSMGRLAGTASEENLLRVETASGPAEAGIPRSAGLRGLKLGAARQAR